MIDSSRLIQKTPQYAISSSNAVTDLVLMEVATQYQTQIAGKMTALKPDDLPRRYATDDHVLAMLKYDGEGVFVYVEATKSPRAFAFNAPSGRVRVGVPAVDDLADRLVGLGVKKALLRCELYLPSEPHERRNSSAEVARASFSTVSEIHARFHLAVLDIVMIDGVDWRVHQNDFMQTWNRLGEWFGSDTQTRVHRPQGDIIPERALGDYFATVATAGGEGLVVRRLNRPEVIKVKPHLTFDTVIVGYVVTDVDGEAGVASLLTALVYPQAPPGILALQVFARVGSGMDDALRRSLLAQLQPKAVQAPMAMNDSDGRPVVFVRPEWVLEIEADDVVVAARNEKENMTQFMSWDGQTLTYHRQALCPRVSFPIFGQLRSDKWAATGAAITQLVAHPVTPPLESVAAGSPPTRLRREVYRKDSKSGDIAVRKLVMIQRHDAEGFPYVVFWTDYSSKRKEPLKVTTQYAMTRERADALAARLIDEYITKGFTRVPA
jgi:ATP dependent DNA ligase C terminal region